MVISAGQQMAEQANANVNIQIFGSILYNVKAYGSKGTGNVDEYASLSKLISSTINGAEATILFPTGLYLIGSNLTIPGNITLQFVQGASIMMKSEKTLTVLGGITAGNFGIFTDQGGIIDLDNSSSEYNLGWFVSGSGYINERWNFAKRAMRTFRTKIIRIPRPYQGQAGSFLSGNRLYWYFSDEIKIDDNQNASTWHIDAEFYAKNACTNFMVFNDAAKPENIYFYGALQAIVPAGMVVTNGINFLSAARVTFFGNVVLGGFQTTVKIGGSDQVAAVGDIRFFQLQCSFYTNTAVSIYGKATYTTQSINIDSLGVTAAQAAGTNAMEWRGLLRDINVRNIYYATDVAKDGYVTFDAGNVVYIESNTEGDIFHCEIGGIMQADATNGITITSTGTDSSKIQNVTVRRIFGKFNNGGAVINYCTYVSLLGIENRSKITVNSGANYTQILSSAALNSVTDNGNFTTINGLGKQTQGVGFPPVPAVLWAIGTLIQETTDKKIYTRIANAGVAADFVKLTPGGYGIATILAAGTSVIVTHGFGYLPTNVTATPKGNVGNVWITSIGFLNFTINCSSAPGSDTAVSWRAD